MAKRGRPTKYTDALAEKILMRLATGESLHRIGQDPAMPSEKTVLKWIYRYPEFRDRYSTSFETRADAVFAQMEQVEQEVRDDKITPQQANVLLTNLRWKLGRMSPSRYGDHHQLDVRNNDEQLVKVIVLPPEEVGDTGPVIIKQQYPELEAGDSAS